MNHLSEPEIHEFLDQELADQQRARIEAHLSSCAECGARLGEIRSIFNMLSDLPEYPLRRDLSGEVRRRLSRERAAIWNPIFAAQLGIVIGTLISVLVSASNVLSIPAISLDAWLRPFPLSIQLGPSTLQFETLNAATMLWTFIAPLPGILSQVPSLRWIPSQPFLTVPAWPQFQTPLSIGPLVLLITGNLLLWSGGNAFLLRRRGEIRK